MTFFETLGLLFFAALAWFWYSSAGAREAGTAAVRAACASEQLQLLDDTVALASVKPQRNEDGHVVLRREYRFEFSDTGDNRRKGSVVLLGQRVIIINIGLRLVTADITLH